MKDTTAQKLLWLRQKITLFAEQNQRKARKYEITADYATCDVWLPPQPLLPAHWEPSVGHLVPFLAPLGLVSSKQSPGLWAHSTGPISGSSEGWWRSLLHLQPIAPPTTARETGTSGPAAPFLRISSRVSAHSLTHILCIFLASFLTSAQSCYRNGDARAGVGAALLCVRQKDRPSMAQLPCFVNTEPLQNDLEVLLTSFIFNIYFNAALLPVLPLPGCFLLWAGSSRLPTKTLVPKLCIALTKAAHEPPPINGVERFPKINQALLFGLSPISLSTSSSGGRLLPGRKLSFLYFSSLHNFSVFQHRCSVWETDFLSQ